MTFSWIKTGSHLDIFERELVAMWPPGLMAPANTVRLMDRLCLGLYFSLQTGSARWKKDAAEVTSTFEPGRFRRDRPFILAGIWQTDLLWLFLHFGVA
jgi:hypothetical protein